MEKDLSVRGDVVRIDKKRWQNPTLEIVSQNNVNGGPVNSVVEATTPSVTATNHS